MKKVYTMMLGAILVGGLFSGCVSNKQVVTLDKMSKQDPEVVQIHKMKIREDQFLTVSKRIFPNAKDTKGLIKTLGTYDGLPSLVDMAYVYSAGGSLLDGQRMREKSSFYSIDDRNRDRLKTLMNSDKRDEYIQILDQKLDTYLANSGVGQTKLRERFVDGYLYISGYKQEKTLEIEAFISSLGGAESQLQLKYTKAVDIYKTQSGGYYVVVAGSILSLPADHIATVDTALMLSLLGEKPENYYLPQEKDLELSVSQTDQEDSLDYARYLSVWLNKKGYVGPKYTEKSLYYMKLA
ncbi:MAG: hypothetical protein U9Q15_00995, partial [Patescibacteria group bacterium]|nr:hypothetical protein [Patescibacteria group bacterium]